MKINPTIAYQYYKPLSSSAQGETGAAKKNAAEKTDIVAISGSAPRRGELSRVTRTMAGELEAPASPARLKALQTAIANKEYYIPTEQLADAVLPRFA